MRSGIFHDEHSDTLIGRQWNSGVYCQIKFPWFLISSHHKLGFWEPSYCHFQSIVTYHAGNIEIATIHTVMNLNKLLLTYLKLGCDFRTGIKPPEEERAEIRHLPNFSWSSFPCWSSTSGAWPTSTDWWESISSLQRYEHEVAAELQNVKSHFLRNLCRAHTRATAAECLCKSCRQHREECVAITIWKLANPTTSQ